MELQGRVAVITGGTRGIGRAIAEGLFADGASVVINGRSAEKCAQALKEMNGGDRVHFVQGDIKSREGCQAIIDAAIAKYGKIDIMVNNAGIGYIMKPIIEMSEGDWNAVLGVNLRGAFFGVKHAAKQMLAQGGGGRIINIGSQASKSGFPFAAAYVSSKHGMVGLTRTAAIELGQHGITVNTICPNHVTTGLGAWQNQYFSAATGRSEEKYLADMRSRIPMGRPGLQEDIAKACAFLASEQAAYITGEAMNVSGGEEYH